jgi:PAS domain S-box-containing protein
MTDEARGEPARAGTETQPAAAALAGGAIDSGMKPDAAAGEAAAREDFVTAMAEVSPAMLWMGDAEGRCLFLNGALRRFWGVNPSNFADFDWTSTVHPDDVEKLGGPFGKAMAEHTPFEVAARYRRADGEWRTMRTRANPRFSAEGQFLGMTGVNEDITDQLVAEEHTRLLLGELNHRTKNILSVVQAIARRTARDAAPEDFVRALNERLTSLSACNDLLLRTDWSGVWLAELAAAQFAPLGELAAERLTVSGPPIRVDSRQAQTLSMALHELSTNSLKYGALMQEGGRVDLRWARRPDGGWDMEWTERVPVPPVPPTRRGFGHTVIVDMVSAALSAEVAIDYPPTGFVWRMTAAG